MIYFLAPDATAPTGGVRQIYVMVDQLAKLGYEAAVFHGSPGFRCDWFENSTRVVACEKLTLANGDILVVPEWGGRRFQGCVAEARVVVLNQNHFNVFADAGFASDWSGVYPGWPNATAVIATSDAIERFLAACLRAPLPIYRVRCIIDAGRLTPGNKGKIISFMPRKRRQDAESLVQLLLRRQSLAAWEIRPLDDINHSDVEAALQETAIFLSLSDREGFGIPPAEAMAAGCYVIGFLGDGGREFMRSKWCSPIEDPDLRSFADEVERVAEAWSAGSPELRTAITEARSFVLDHYNMHGFRDDLQRVFAELTSPESPAIQPRPVLVRHYSTNQYMGARRGPLWSHLRKVRDRARGLRSTQPR